MAKKTIKAKTIGECGTCENHYNEYGLAANGKPIQCQCILSKWHKLMSDSCENYTTQTES